LNVNYKWCYSCLRGVDNCNCLDKYRGKLLVSKIGEKPNCSRCNSPSESCICIVCNRCGKHNDTISKDCTCIKCDGCRQWFNTQELYNKHLCPECNKCQKSGNKYNRYSIDNTSCTHCGSHYIWYRGSQQWWIECNDCNVRNSTLDKLNERCECSWRSDRSKSLVMINNTNYIPW